MVDEISRVLNRAKIIAGAIIAALLVGGGVVMALRVVHAHALADATTLHAKQYVQTVQPKSGGDATSVTLPGTLQGFIEATVYARSSGYVVRWLKDIGAPVNKGALLAEITAPEVDQELYQAEAARAQAAASAALAKSTAERWQRLRVKDAVTQQDLDERLSAYSQAQANLAAAEANVARLRSLQGFNKVVAPFDGVVTRRDVDVGDLVDAGNGGAGKALFSVAQVDPLRLYVYVPQAYAHLVKVGDAVTVTLAERAGEEYRGTIANTARAIDTSTRTMQVEIRVPNPRGELIAGSYVQVSLPIRTGGSALEVPSNVLLFRPDGPRVALVDGGGRVRLAAVRLGTDFGNSIAILSGVSADDRIILNPADSITDGDIVTLADAAAPPLGGKTRP
ncbi:MAG: efflux RND transporter periplasmic adaptor subunit [Steroidobacteraceae bacterium]